MKNPNYLVQPNRLVVNNQCQMLHVEYAENNKEEMPIKAGNTLITTNAIPSASENQKK